MTDAFQSKMRQILEGQIKYTSGNLGFNMLISRERQKIANNGANINDCMVEIENFIERFEGIMKDELLKIEAL